MVRGWYNAKPGGFFFFFGNISCSMNLHDVLGGIQFRDHTQLRSDSEYT